MLGKQLIQAAAGAAGAGGDPVYVDDVFSTYLWEGDSEASQTITNGIDLAGEGGLVWVKGRTVAYNNILFDTERGNTSSLKGNTTDAAETISTRVSGFLSNGFTVGSNGNVNAGSVDYASWSFRKAPGFFDVVTYTGNGTAGRTVAHNLGSEPGMIIVKRYDATENWTVYHRSTGTSKFLFLDDTMAAQTASSAFWNNTAPTSTNFTVGTNGGVNASGGSYVAYVFAHDSQTFGTDSDESIVKCGSYTGSSSGVNINLGFEPQWVMVKRTDGSGSWYIMDAMRGFTASNDPVTLKADSADAEGGLGKYRITSTGFDWNSDSGDSGQEYIYMAIRRPHKPPTAGTEVLAISLQTPQNSWTPGFVSDSMLFTQPSSIIDKFWSSRLQGNKAWLLTNSTAAESSSSTAYFHYDDPTNTMRQTYFQGGADCIFYAFKRAPGFFDVVGYTGDNTNKAYNHNLGVKPELMLRKSRGGTADWIGYSATLGAGYFLTLNDNNGALGGGSNTSRWNNTEPTATQFTVGGSFSPAEPFLVLLFATLSGISKVGSYTGTGNAINIDCGFSNGARFVLIKRTDSNGNWVLFDSTRGIVSGNDPYFKLNTTEAQKTDENHIGPLNAGFTVSAGSGGDSNNSGASYIFLAIA